MERRPLSKVNAPNDLIESNYCGKIFGFHHPESDVFNIIGTDPGHINNQQTCFLGYVSDTDIEFPKQSDVLYGIRNDFGIEFEVNGRKLKTEPYSLVLDIFSRNTGILETGQMLNKHLFLLGCGSVGSLVALELAKAGVSNFTLVDTDELGYHNICRHQCGVSDVGRYKVNAVKDKILNINPTAKVTTHINVIERLPKEVFDNACLENETILVGCGDNRESDLYANRIAHMYNIPFVSIGFWERAYAGEIFYYIPSEDMPCYQCAFGQLAFAAKPASNHRFYSNEAELEKLSFEPGISADINFVTIIGIKLLLDLYNRNSNTYKPKVLNNLTQYTLVCNTNDPSIGGPMAEIFAHPLQVTRSIQLSFNTTCPICQNR
ncbi:MAG: HesA/MoeB/ThiF family protein [Solirubrobacterales bacterium]